MTGYKPEDVIGRDYNFLFIDPSTLTSIQSAEELKRVQQGS